MVDVVSVGCLVLDRTLRLSRLPESDEKLPVLEELCGGGGMTANYAVGVARLGLSAGFVGAVGQGRNDCGDFLLDELAREGVDVNQVVRKNTPTPQNIILVMPGDKRILESRYMLETRPDVKDLREEYIRSARHLHIAAEHFDVCYKACEIAKSNGLSVSLDLEKQIIKLLNDKELEKLLGLCDYVAPNRLGLRELAGCDDFVKASEVLLGYGPKMVVTTLGEEGCLIVTEKERLKVPAFRTEVVDLTGAGDCFNAAFTFGYLRGWDLKRIGTFANAAAALKISKFGTRTGLPSYEQVESMITTGASANVF